MQMTINHPAILKQLASFPIGVQPAKFEGKILLLVKGPKEMILTAKLKQGFSFYLVPLEQGGIETVGLVTAFFDDADEPLTLSTPLFDDDLTHSFLKLLKQEFFDVYFFDENNRELLNCKAQNLNKNYLAAPPRNHRFLEGSPQEAWEINNKLRYWFSNRTKKHDERSLPVKFVEDLFPSGIFFMDIRPEAHSYHGTKGFSHNTLERDIEPGAFQERDIAQLLLRMFSGEQIYLNPYRASEDRKELVDVLVVGQRHALFIQAKDSPNTEDELSNTIKRKRGKALSQLQKGGKQLLGALSYSKRNEPMPLAIDGEILQVSLEGLQIVGLIIVRELFADTYKEYEEANQQLIDSSRLPSLFMDYPQFHLLTHGCKDEEDLIARIHWVYETGMKDGFSESLYYGFDRPASD